MQTYSAQSNSEYLPQDDESEAKRLEVLSNNGIGETHYLNDEDIKGYSLREYGMGI